MYAKVVGFFSIQPFLESWFVMVLVALLLLVARKRKAVYTPFLILFATGFLALLGFAIIMLADNSLLRQLVLSNALGQLLLAIVLQGFLFFGLLAALEQPLKAKYIVWQLVAALAQLLPVAGLLVFAPPMATATWLLSAAWLVLAGQSATYVVLVLKSRRLCRLSWFCLILMLLTFAYPVYHLARLWLELPFLPDPAEALQLASFFWFIVAFGVFSVSLNELVRGDKHTTALDEYISCLTDSVKRFIPGEFLHQLSKDAVTDLKLGDHIKKDMTIFFSDIRAFTELSEILTPEENFAFINSYFSRMVPLINEHGGFVDKYMGDGIMALFPADNGADNALQAAMAMQLKVSEYNGHRAKTGYRAISLGVGIHTGTLMLGIVGVDNHMEGTVVSDAVNLSSRLQSIAKAFNLATVISEATFMALNSPGEYKYRFIGKVRVKGKQEPVSVFEIFDGLPPDIFDRKMSSNRFFEQGMLAYYQKDYTEAVFYFKRALEAVPEDGAARFYLEVCLRKSMGKVT